MFPCEPVGIYLFNVNYEITRTMCGICPKLPIKTQEQRHWRYSGVFNVNFEETSHIVLIFHCSDFPLFWFSIIDCEKANAGWEWVCKIFFPKFGLRSSRNAYIIQSNIWDRTCGEIKLTVFQLLTISGECSILDVGLG